MKIGGNPRIGGARTIAMKEGAWHDKTSVFTNKSDNNSSEPPPVSERQNGSPYRKATGSTFSINIWNLKSTKAPTGPSRSTANKVSSLQFPRILKRELELNECFAECYLI
jgi:hypothetical protein